MDKEKIIEMAKLCPHMSECERDCKYYDVSDGENCTEIFAKFITDNFGKENEPAPSANDTSSKNNNLQLNDTANLATCQEKIADIKEDLLLIYEDMTNEEQRAWELGEIFNQVTNLLKSGDNK